ncbi:formylmethanofuran--tetrahydromethanopterin N-formyltransferase [Planctomicrobium sp. SH661]|uniref:formylmethanofuran--tetrahydromethanopterin N-formyltransferase n=1 Tax=Planctomicrobium sp. SH661 TaxID=3448124 RepID=UPI003F5B3454
MASETTATNEMFSLHGVKIVDTFAEAFPMKATRLILTAVSERWAMTAATELCGNATSVIACDAEAAVERLLSPDETPDGRPGVAVLVFAFSRDGLEKALQNRVGQCVLTCPTTACYNGLPDGEKDKRIQIGGALRFFGDGRQTSKQIQGRRYWRIPVMDGEFLCEDRFHTTTGVGGGNLIFCAIDQESALQAAEVSAAAMRTCADVILPFPGGIVRSGSKVGSRYKKLRASTNDAYCPTSRPLTKTDIPDGCNAVYEIVIDGLTSDAIQSAMRAGLQAAATVPGLLQITAGNYGGKLGKFHFYLKELL